MTRHELDHWLDSPDMDFRLFALMGQIWWLCSQQPDGRANFQQAALASRLKLSLRTTNRMIKRLRQLGAIEVTRTQTACWYSVPPIPLDVVHIESDAPIPVTPSAENDVADTPEPAAPSAENDVADTPPVAFSYLDSTRESPASQESSSFTPQPQDEKSIQAAQPAVKEIADGPVPAPTADALASRQTGAGARPASAFDRFAAYAADRDAGFAALDSALGNVLARRARHQHPT